MLGMFTKMLIIRTMTMIISCLAGADDDYDDDGEDIHDVRLAMMNMVLPLLSFLAADVKATRYLCPICE